MNTTVKKYLGIGIMLGIVFPVGAIAFEMVRSGGLTSIIELHKSNPLLYIIDTAPLFLGFVSYIAGLNQMKSEELLRTVEYNKEQIELALAKTEESHRALTSVFDSIKSTSPELVACVGHLDTTILNIIDRLDHLTSITTSSISGVSNSLDITSKKMTDSSSFIEESQRHTKICEELTNDYIDRMGHIKESVTIMNSTFSDIREYSKEFDTIIGFINKVSKETRLLSLNASVEASRAGNEGSGFSVIASNIRSMSEDISDATERISGQISKMHELIDVLDTNLSSIKYSVSVGSKLTLDTKETLKGISNQINSLKLNMSDISVEIHDQVKLVKDIGRDSDKFNITANDIKLQLNESKTPIKNTMDIILNLQHTMESKIS